MRTKTKTILTNRCRLKLVRIVPKTEVNRYSGKEINNFFEIVDR